jgi:hypothetical protein
MTDLQRALQALRAADAAGNTEDATKLAALVRQLQGSSGAPEAPAPTSNVLAGAAQRGLDLVAGLPGFVNQASDLLDRQVKDTPLEFISKNPTFGGPEGFSFKDPDEVEDVFEIAEGGLKSAADSINYQPKVSWEDVKKDPSPGNIASFALREGVVSTPDMAAALAALPAYLLARSSQLAEDAAAADGRDTVNATDLARGMATAGVVSALERTGAAAIFKGTGAGSMLGRVVGATGKEAVTEGAQEFVEDFGTTLGTETGFDPARAADRAAAGAVAGGGYGGAFRGGMETGKAVSQIPDVARQAKARLDYSHNPDQVASDLRVADMYDRMKASVEGLEGGTSYTNDVIFKGIHDALKADLIKGIEGLYQTNNISKEARDQLLKDADAVIKQAGQHNREMSEDDIERVERLGLEPAVQKGLIDAFRDLNTATHAGMKKNVTGPVERFTKAVIRPTGAGAGAIAGGPAGAVGGDLVAKAAQGGAQKVARGIDKFFDLQDPTIIRRANARRKALAGRGVQHGDTPRFLDDLKANVGARAQVSTSQAAQQARRAAELRSKRRLADLPGVQGFDKYVYDLTGLKPAEVDKGLMTLLARGEITPEQQAAFLSTPRDLMENNQGNHIVDLLDGLVQEGVLKPGEGFVRPQGPQAATVPSGVRNPAAYAATVRTAEAGRDAAIASAPTPELQGVVTNVADARSTALKGAIYRAALRAHPEHKKWLQDVVKPLTKFGPQEEQNASTGSQGSPETTPAHGTGPSGITPFSLGPGAPKVGPVFAPEGGRQGLAGLPQIDNSVQEGSRLTQSVMEMPGGGEILEMTPGHAAAGEFHSAIDAAKGANAHGAAVYVYSPEEYAEMRLFMSPNRDYGFAIKGKDIVSVFKHPDAKGKGLGEKMAKLAVEQGGRTLDAFDTVLPIIYAKAGFRPVARLPWNDEYSPSDWDKKAFKDFNKGEPDVVFMVYDGERSTGVYNPLLAPRVDDYDAAVARQEEALQSGAIAAIDDMRAMAEAQRKGLTPEEQQKVADIRDRVPGIRRVLNYLLPDEARKLKAASAQKISDFFDAFPSAEEVASVAFSGRAKRGWYQNSAKALVEVFGAVDAPRFAALLAATSPQTSVETNTINALNIWAAWENAGRPTDRDAIVKLMGQSVLGQKGEDSVLGAWVNNTVTALTADNPQEVPISGPKVNSFMLNLRGVVDEVTNDAWIANFLGVPQEIFAKRGQSPGKGPGYIAASALMRKAAKILSKRTGQAWTPAEVQETVWSWAKTLYEKRAAAGEDRTTREILEAGDLTHEQIADTPDFELLFVSGVYRKILEEGGYGDQIRQVEGSIRRRNESNRGYGEGRSVADAEGAGIAPSSFQRHLASGAGRLERLFLARKASRQ